MDEMVNVGGWISTTYFEHDLNVTTYGNDLFLSNQLKYNRLEVANSFPDVISVETKEKITDFISCYVLPIVFIFGSTGNVLSLIVLVTEGLEDNTNFILLGLTVADLFYVITNYIPKISCIVGYFSVVNKSKMLVLTQYFMDALTFVFGRVSALFVCLIALERFIVVVFPLKAFSILTPLAVRCTCVFIYALVIGMALPVFFMSEIIYVFDSVYNQTMPAYKSTAFLQEFPFLMEKYVSVALNVMFRIIPVLLVIVLTCFILIILTNSSKWRDKVASSISSRRLEKERKLTKTLVSVCLVYSGCNIPVLMFYLASGFFPGLSMFGQYKNLSTVLYRIVLLAEVIHSSVNFLLYMTTSTRFVSSFKRIFGCSKIIRTNIQESKMI